MTEAGSITGSRGAPKFDHSSPVLERQGRQSRDRRDLESQARQNRSPVTARQSARGDRRESGERGNREQRIRSGRVTSVGGPGAAITTSERRCACPLYVLLSPAGYSWVSCYKDCSNL